MEDRYNKALQLLDSIGLRLLQEGELKEIAEAYQHDLLNGLQSKHSSLQMLPTYLTLSESKHVYNNTNALVIEIGGTNIAAAKVIIDSEDTPVVEKWDYYKGKLGRTLFYTTDDFFEEIFFHIDFLLKGEIPPALGIIYSFPGKTIQTAYGIDMVSSNKLPKDFIIPGIDKEPVGSLFIQAMKKNYNVPESVKIVVLNDTSAVLLSDVEAAVGCVLGTGFNIAIAVDKQIINSESGGFSQIPQYEISSFIDQQSTNPGKQLAEKQISGLYLGLLFKRTTNVLEQKQLLNTSRHFMTTEDISRILETEKLDFISDSIDNQILQEVAKRLAIRSAQITGTMIGTIMKTFEGDFTQNDIPVPIEGSVFWGIPAYPEHCKKFAEKLVPDKTITFLNIDNAGMIGAARAVLQL